MHSRYFYLLLVPILGLPVWVPTLKADIPFGSPLDIPNSVVNLSSQILSLSTDFLDMIQVELGATGLGRDLTKKGQYLAAVAMQYQQAVRIYRADRKEANDALIRVENAMRAVQLTMGDYPAAAPRSQLILWDLYQLVRASRASHNRAISEANKQLPPPIPPLHMKVDALVVVNRNLAVGLRGYSSKGPFYVGLFRDVLALGGLIDRLDRQVEDREPLQRLQSTCQRIRRNADDIDRKMRDAALPVRQGWRAVENQLRVVYAEVGTSARPIINPVAPVVIDPPSFSGLPVGIDSGVIGHRHRQLITKCDELANELDSYLRTMVSLKSRNPTMIRYLDELREMRQGVTTIRRACDQGRSGVQLREMHANLRVQSRQVQVTHAALLRQKIDVRPTLFSQITQSERELNRLLPN